MKSIRIGAGQGFYGDTVDGALRMARYGDVQYICFDTLAELTMAILHKDAKKNPRGGFPKDFAVTLRTLLPYVKEKGIKLITNAGGINPVGARDLAVQIARELGIHDLRIGIATGDNLVPFLHELGEKGVKWRCNGETLNSQAYTERLLFANAYLGATPIVRCLEAGADIVITGRTTDSAQFLAPMIYELKWRPDDWDKLAQGVLLGHLMECSAQSTGGNFSGDWWNIEGYEEIGYPLCEVSEDGSALLTKPPQTGGRVSVETVREQFLYELHNPAEYLTPDVTCDFSQVAFHQEGENQVRILGARGTAAPPTLKAVMGISDGYMGQGMVGYSWPDAKAKCEKVLQIIQKQAQLQQIPLQAFHHEFLGLNSLHGPLAHGVNEEELNECYLRVAVKTERKEDAERFGRLFPPLALNGPPFIGGLSSMWSARALSQLASALIPREWVETRVVHDVVEV